MSQTTHHWVRSGNLDQNAVTAELRDRFMYDGQWACDECRPYLEQKEGYRIYKAFTDEEMWVTVVPTTMRERAVGQARAAGVRFAAVPLYNRTVVLFTTGPICDQSELADDPVTAVFSLVMPYRWKFEKEWGISSTRGFLPPAREYEGFEAYRKQQSNRCWHIHPDREEAKECAQILGLEEGGRWYTRGTNPWHSVGRLRVVGPPLEDLAEECEIGVTRTGSKVSDLQFEPMVWDDPRLRRFLARAGWSPPHDAFEPPPLAIEIRVVVKRGLMSGQARWRDRPTG